MTVSSSKSKYLCRKAELEDAEIIHDLMRKAFADYGKANNQEKEIVNSALKEELEDVYNDIKENIVLVLSDNQQIIASLRLEEISHKRYLLKRFAVAPAYQNHGLGTMLFNSAVDNLKEADAHYLQLYSSLENKKLINFYKGLGFNCLDTDSKKGYERGLWVKIIK